MLLKIWAYASTLILVSGEPLDIGPAGFMVKKAHKIIWPLLTQCMCSRREKESLEFPVSLRNRIGGRNHDGDQPERSSFGRS